MREFIITTESNSDMDPVFLSENHVGVIPHYYTVEDKMYGGGEELTIREFYDAMRAKKKVGTMASNPAVIEEMFTKYAEEGKDILHISFSSAMSGGFGNVKMMGDQVMEEHPGMKIIVLDTLSASLCEGMMIVKALELKKEGKSIEETADAIRALIPHLSAVFTVDDLDTLYRGGRLSKSTAVLGTMVQIKPILCVNDEGKLVACGKTRGRKKAFAEMIRYMEQKIGNMKDKQIFIGIIHGDCEEEAKKVADMIREKLGYDHIVIRPIGPSIGAHSGPGTIGIEYLGEER